MHAASLDTGFFVAVGHGLDREMSDLFDHARSFFARPQADKELVPRVGRYGYVPHRRHAIDADRLLGDTEYIDLGLTDEVPLATIEAEIIRAYQQSALAVGLAIVSALAQTLELPADTFDAAMIDPQCRLRFLHYLPTAMTSDGERPELTAPHTDYGLITLLATDGVPGLEVKSVDGGWAPVAAPAGALIVNLGDMLARWTNDRFQSTQHRVIGGPDRDRVSIPFFVNPNPATLVECLPSCVTESNPCRYEPVTAGEFLAARIDGRI